MDCIRENINPEIFLHKNLSNIPNLFDKENDQLFDGDDLIESKVELLISFGGDGTLLDLLRCCGLMLRADYKI